MWKGRKLGNPKDAQGNKTLEGFDAYTQTENYQNGPLELVQISKDAEGVVAIACIEQSEVECHRTFILRDPKTLENQDQ